MITVAPASGSASTFAALRHPNYRLWFLGQLVSLFGSWMQLTAQGFLVYELTHSTAYLGLVAFAGGFPTWLLSLYAGAVADRVDRRKLLMATQVAMMIPALLLAFLTGTGLVQPMHIVLLALVLGACNAFEVPARQAFVLEMVSREDLTNAIALNASMFNLAAVVGPAAAGLVYAHYGPAWCFAVNGISFAAVITALAAMRLKPSLSSHLARDGDPVQASDGLLEGVRFALREPTVRAVIATVAVTALFGISFGTLLPSWAVSVLGGDATTNGYLQSARGLGALGGSLLIATLGRRVRRGRLLTAGSFGVPLFILIFAGVRSLPIALLVLVAIGVSFMWVMNLANSTVQTLVPDELRGRVMGFYSMVFFGSLPLGSLWVGFAANHFGQPAPLVIGAVLCLAYALVLARSGILWNVS